MSSVYAVGGCWCMFTREQVISRVTMEAEPMVGARCSLSALRQRSDTAVQLSFQRGGVSAGEQRAGSRASIVHSS